MTWDATRNLIIEGDNLEVLKLLQKSYLGKVKMIYIDPPYNTGNDFVYPDNYEESLQTYLEYTGQVDCEGKKFSTNTDSDGRFHSKWLNMMYPRLYLARNLLKEDGLLFVSIDDIEVTDLRRICDEVFGEENFVDTIIWKKRYGGGAKEKFLVSLHEYILVYARDASSLPALFVPQTEDSISRYYALEDENVEKRGRYRTHPLEATKSMGNRPNLVFPITAPDGAQVLPKRQWLWSKDRVDRALAKNGLAFLKDKEGNWTVHTKQYLKDEEGVTRQSKAFSIIDDIFTQHGTNEILDLFGDAHVFPFPKPTALIQRLIEIGAPGPSDLVLDFFAGSGSTAHAVLDLNRSKGGERSFILIQLPEPTGRTDFSTIVDITKERVRRVLKKLNTEDKSRIDSETEDPHDRGFRVFKLAESNFKPWDATAAKEASSLQKQLDDHVHHIRADRTVDDILVEILLKSGFPLTTPVESLILVGKRVLNIADGALLVCLDRNLTLEVVRAMAQRKPERIVCLDEGFAGNDQLKANAVQTFRTNGVTSFKTV